MIALLDRFAAAGWIFAVCTNKLEGLSRLLLAELGIEDRFAAICGGDTFATRKPDPAHLLDTIAAARGTPEAALMVGDSRTDLDTARSAGVPFDRRHLRLYAGADGGARPRPPDRQLRRARSDRGTKLSAQSRRDDERRRAV